ncbi:AMP-dependent synthetase and ligase, partial [Halorubrum distributum JCM 13561]
VPESGDPDDAGATPEQLKAFVRERVADYKTPGEVEFVAELPTTATGKIQKYELREREWDEEDRMVGEG